MIRTRNFVDKFKGTRMVAPRFDSRKIKGDHLRIRTVQAYETACGLCCMLQKETRDLGAKPGFLVLTLSF